MGSRRVLALLLLAGCGQSDLAIRVDKPWAEDAPAVAIASLPDGALLPPTPTVIAPGARLELSFEDVPFLLRLAAFLPEDAAGLVACGVRVGGGRPLLPTPTGNWTSRYDPAQGPEILAESQDPAADLRYDSCDPPTACDGLAQSFWVLPWPGLKVTELDWLPGDRWLVVGTPLHLATGLLNRVGILSADGVLTELAAGFSERILGAAWDRATQIQLSFAGGRRVAFNVEGTPELSELSPTFPSGGRIVARPDGLLLLHARSGPVTILRQPSGTSVEASAFPPAIDVLEMASPSEMAVISGANVLLWDPAAHSFVESKQLPVIDAENSLVFSAGALGVFGKTFAFMYQAAEWRALPSSPAVNVTSATGLNDGMLVLGGVGGAAYFRRQAWCPLATAFVFAAFHAAATSPDGHTAAAGSDAESDAGSPKVLTWK